MTAPPGPDPSRSIAWRATVTHTDQIRRAEPVGVLALQGAFQRHVDMFAAIGVPARLVKTPNQLDDVARLVIPGGESTTMNLLLDRNDLRQPIADRITEGMPVFGTCAGMIVLAAEVLDGRADQVPLKAIDITVRRNAYGRQIDSFEGEVSVPVLGEPPLTAIFIRAPGVESVGGGVEVLAVYDGSPVVCREGAVLVSSFHPELSTDPRLHRYFIESVGN